METKKYAARWFVIAGLLVGTTSCDQGVTGSTDRTAQQMGPISNSLCSASDTPVALGSNVSADVCYQRDDSIPAAAVAKDSAYYCKAVSLGTTFQAAAAATVMDVKGLASVLSPLKANGGLTADKAASSITSTSDPGAFAAAVFSSTSHKGKYVDFDKVEKLAGLTVDEATIGDGIDATRGIPRSYDTAHGWVACVYLDRLLLNSTPAQQALQDQQQNNEAQQQQQTLTGSDNGPVITDPLF